jgi:thiol-disulfide isomerase/thioredoxin
MRKAFFLIGILVLTAIGPTLSVAAPATTTGVGILFGGQSFEANQSGSSTVNFSEMPSIVEVYTATWCSNCVDVEHALENIENETGLQQYHTHRAINEVQDPLGTIEIDQRFHDRYGVRAPPVVVFNGSVIKPGSVTDADSLESEFTSLAQQSMEITGTSTFTWNTTSNSTGTAAWSIEPQDLAFINQLDGYDSQSSLFAYAWIVEQSAFFEEGSNGLGDYPHVVRGIIELGEINMTSNDLSGSANITLPPAYDGNDLSIHLIYQFNVPAEVEEPEAESPPLKESPEEGLPAASLITSLCIIFAAALTRRERI